MTVMRDTRTRSASDARDELDRLIVVDPRRIGDFEGHAFDLIAGPFGRDLVLFGAGGLGRRTLDGLRRLGIEPLAFADNDRRLHGSEIRGVRVMSVEDAAARFNGRATFVVTIWGSSPNPRRYLGAIDQLDALGCGRHVHAGKLFWKYPGTFLPFYALDLPSRVLPHADAVRHAFGLMADEASRREFVAQIRWRLRLDFEGLPSPAAEEMYFCDSLCRPDAGEVFVDCGAYDGDTLRSFLARRGTRFRHYLAIEPDPVNYRGLADCVAGMPPAIVTRISSRRLAVGDRRATLRLDPTGTPSTTVGDDGSVQVECVPLDDLLANLAPTTIKMDIEGAEPAALRGAGRVIAEHSPVLAACVYHAQDHVWSIPNLIHDLNPEYSFYLRPHKGEAWDLVCYAVPPGRRARAAIAIGDYGDRGVDSSSDAK